MSRDGVLLRGVCRVCSGLMRHPDFLAGIVLRVMLKGLSSDTLDSMLLLGVGS